MMIIPRRAGSFLICRVNSRPSIRGSWRSIRIRRGVNDSRMVSATSASVAVLTSYPSARRITFANLRFCALSSTMRIGSEVITALWRQGCRQQQPPQLLDERLQTSRALGDDCRCRRLKPAALTGIQVLDRPHKNGYVAPARTGPQPRDEFEAVHVRHEQVHDHDRRRVRLRQQRIHGIVLTDGSVSQLPRSEVGKGLTSSAGAIVIPRGRIAENVLPFPGMLCTATRPACASTSRLVSARDPGPCPDALSPSPRRAAGTRRTASPDSRPGCRRPCPPRRCGTCPVPPQ